MGDKRLDLPQGTLDLLILKALALEPQHGWGISERLRQISTAAPLIPPGIPVIRLCTGSSDRGRIKARWASSVNNRRAKYYELTRKGRAQLGTETNTWRRLAAAVAQVLETGSS